jgi:hypothetical protein
MAESYVNPFGGYLSGYTQGADLEDRLQRNTRDAREEDWRHQNLDPLTLKTAQRADTLGDYRLPYEKDATNDASVISRAGAEDARLRTAGNVALTLRDTGPLNDAGHYYDPKYQDQDATTLQRGADFQRNQDIYGTQAKIADEAAQASLRAAQGDYYGNRNQTAVQTATIRSQPPAAAAPSPVNRLFPTAPPTPAATPAAPAVAPGATPPAPGTVSPQGDYTPSDQGNGVAVAGFHELHPVAQAHVIHYASQLTGHPPEAIAAHIAASNPQHYSDPYNPGQTSNPNDAASYYAKPSANFATA